MSNLSDLLGGALHCLGGSEPSVSSQESFRPRSDPVARDGFEPSVSTQESFRTRSDPVARDGSEPSVSSQETR